MNPLNILRGSRLPENPSCIGGNARPFYHRRHLTSVAFALIYYIARLVLFYKLSREFCEAYDASMQKTEVVIIDDEDRRKI